MKIFLCGQKYFGWLIFKLIRDLGHDVVGVSAPYGDRLYKSAYHHDVPVLLQANKRLLNSETMPDGADLIVAAHSYDYVGLKTLGKTKLGGIGYHPSLLPLHRGRDAIKWTIRMGDKVTGGSVYWLSKGVDAGPIAVQDWCFVPNGWDDTRLWREKLQPMGVKLMAKSLCSIANGRLVKVPQDHSIATWEPSMDQPPLYRPDLPQLGSIDGYEVVTSLDDPSDYAILSRGHWKTLAGG